MSKLNTLFIGAAALLGASVAQPAFAQDTPSRPPASSAPPVDAYMADDYGPAPDPYAQAREDGRQAGLRDRSSRFNNLPRGRVGDPSNANSTYSTRNNLQHRFDDAVGRNGREVLGVLGYDAGRRIGLDQNEATIRELTPEQQAYTRARLRAVEGMPWEPGSRSNDRVNNWLSNQLPFLHK